MSSNPLEVFVYGFNHSTKKNTIEEFIEKKLNDQNIFIAKDSLQIKKSLSLHFTYAIITLKYVENVATLRKLFKYTEFEGMPIHFSQRFDFSIKKVIFIDDVAEGSYKEIDKTLNEDFEIVFVQSIIQTENGKFKATVYLNSEEEADRCSQLLTNINGRPVNVRKATMEEFIEDQTKLGTIANCSTQNYEIDDSIGGIQNAKALIKDMMHKAQNVKFVSYKASDNYQIEKSNLLPDSYYSFLDFYTPSNDLYFL